MKNENLITWLAGEKTFHRFADLLKASPEEPIYAYRLADAYRAPESAEKLGPFYHALEVPIYLVADVPAWIDRNTPVGNARDAARRGCASGAYIPAVIPHSAAETLLAHGEEMTQWCKPTRIWPAFFRETCMAMVSQACELWFEVNIAAPYFSQQTERES